MVNVVMLCAVEHVPCFCRRHGLEAVGTVVRLDFVRDTEPAADIQTVTTKIYPTQRLRHSATAFVADDVFCVCVCVFCLGLSVPQIIDYDGSEMTAVTPRPH